MTVLEKYQRLEAEGVWHPSPTEQRRDVLVFLGDATLTITTPREKVLAHWSLPALVRTNPGNRPALYAPGEDAPDLLELTDETMVDAIEKVLRALRKGQPKPGALRSTIASLIGAALLLLAVFWLPDALRSHAASLVSDVVRQSMGRELMVELQRLTGPACDDPAGRRALDRLSRRLFPGEEVRLAVLPSALTGTAHLPGGRIAIGRRAVEEALGPEDLARHLLAERLRLASGDPVRDVLDHLGLGASLRLLTTGRLSDAAEERAARALVTEAPEAVDEGALADLMAAARIRTDAESEPVLSDGNWLALRGICGN